MANAKLNIDVGYTIDKNSFNQIMDGLDRVQAKAKSMGNSKDSNLKRQFQEAGEAAKQLQSIMQSSWDSKLNQVNLTKLNTEFKNANMTATKFYNQIGQGGKEGAASANMFARSILDANIQLTQTNKLLDKMAVTFGNTVRYGISSSIFNSFTNAVQRAYDYTKQLDTSLNDIRIVSNQSAEQMEQFAISANKAAQALGRTTLDYTKAATIYFQQGLSSEEVEKRTEVTLKAANVTGQNAQEVSEQLTAVWNGYQVTGEKLEEYVDKLSAVAAHSASNLKELSTGMSKVAAAANVMGVDIDQLTAQMSTIISVTRQAPESVGTALRTIYARIADIKAGLDDETSLGNYSGKMAKLGFNVLDASGNLKDMGEVIEEIGNKWQDLTREQQISLAQTMAGTRQYNNLLTLFDNWDKYESALETSTNAAGTLQRQQDIYMESTEAHLKQLTAEAEELYATLFDQDAARGFIDILSTGLKSINNYIKVLGGGMNAFLGMGAQVANLFSNQIANSINTKIENREVKKAQQDDTKLKEEMAMVHSFEGDQVSSRALDEELIYARKILDVRKNLTQEQAKELVEHQKRIGLLEEEKIRNEHNLKQEKNKYQLAKRENQDNVEILTKLSKEIDADEKVFDSFDKVEEQIEKRHERLSDLLEKLKTEEVDSTEWTNTNNEIEQEKIYIGALQERKEMLTDINNIEKNNADVIKEQGDHTKAINEGTKSASRKGDIQKTVRTVTATLQAATLMIGAIQTFSDEASTGADKANAAWQGVFGAGSAIANAILPGSGFIVQGIGALGQGILEATGLWEGFEDLFKSSKEKLAEIDAEIKQIKQDIQDSENEYEKNASGVKYFEDIKERFEYLQELAQKGLLPDDLRDEYESYLKKVQEYNEDALITYDDQGKMISANTQLMEETIEKLKEENKQIRATIYSAENWDKLTDEYESKYEAKYAYREIKDNSKQQIAFAKYINPMGNTKAGKYFSDKEAFAPSLDDVVKNYDKVIENAKTEYDNYIDKVFKQYTGYTTKEFEQLSDEEKKKVDIKNQQMWDEIQYATDYLKYFKEHVAKAKSEFQTETFNQNLKPELDKTLILNDLKYDSDNQTFYDSFSELGFTNADQLLTNYLKGIEEGLSVEDYKEGIYDKVRQELLDFEKDITLIFKNTPTLMDLYQDVLNVTGKTSQEFENKTKDAINAFLAEITDKADYEKIKPYLEKMFDLENLDTHWSEKDKRAYVGNAEGTTNLVTKGERRARDIGEIISSYYDTSESRKFGYDKDQKQKFKDQIEQYLQNNLDETDLKNLDTTKLTASFNQKLYNAFDPSSGQLKEGFSLDAILQSAIDEQQNTAESSIAKTISRMGELDKDVSEEELKQYAAHLTEVAEKSNLVSNELKKNADAATRVANAVIRMNDGIENLKENLDDWKDILKKSDKASQEYADAVSGVREATSDLLDVEAGDLSEAFLTNKENLELLTKAAKGNEEAIDQLRANLIKDIVLNIAMENNINEQTIKGIKSDLDALRNYDIKIGATIDTSQMAGDEAKFLQTCQKIINDAGMTTEQANAFFDKMGFQANYKTEDKEVEQKVPRYVTTKKITKWDNGEPVEWSESSYQDGYDTFKGVMTVPALAVSADGRKTPIIQSLTKTSGFGSGILNNYSSKNTGAKKSGGSSAKPAKKDLNKEQLDRYQLVNVQLKEISKQLSKLDKQKNKLLGGKLINNLNQQVKLLNDQIDVTDRKLAIAKKEKDEVANTLSKYGIKFDSDGNIANYAQIFNQQQAKLNAVYTKYNNMSKAAQEKYQETLKAAEESWKTFKESITRYDNLIGDTIPGLEQDMADSVDKRIEIFIEEFNAEIKVRLDMSEMERDWNEFYSNVISDLNDPDILKNAKVLRENFGSYFKENGTGEVQSLVSQLENQFSELKKQDETNGKGLWYEDDRKSAIEDTKENLEKLQSALTAVIKLEEELQKKVIDMMNESQEKFNEQINNYERVNKLIEHNIELIKLATGENNHKELAKEYAQQTKNRQEVLKFYVQQKEFWAERKLALKEGTEEWQEACEKEAEAIENTYNSLIEANQAALTQAKEDILAIFQVLNDELTGGKGLDYINTEWELLGTNSEMVLDNINRMQKFQDLSKKYNDAINSTSNIAAQKKLAQLRDQELDALKQIDNLTEKDVERAEKKLEIIKAQIALEDAQANKSKMRLRRDSQGNYRYQFVADEEELQKAQDNLSNAYNELYNFDKERYKSNLNEAYEAYVEWQEKRAAASTIPDEMEAERQLALIDKEYQERSVIIAQENARIKQELNQSTFAELNSLYNQNAENYNLMTEEQKAALSDYDNANQTAFDLVFDLYTENTERFHNMTQDQIDVIQTQMVPQWISGYQEIIDAIEGEGGVESVFNRVASESNDAINNYNQALAANKELFKGTAESYEAAMALADETVNKMLQNDDELINKYKDLNSQVVGLYTEVQNWMEETFQSDLDKAKQTAQEIYDYLQNANNTIANDYKNNVQNGPTQGGTGQFKTEQQENLVEKKTKKYPDIGTWVTLPTGTYFYNASGNPYKYPSRAGRSVQIKSTSGEYWKVYNSELDPSTVYIKKSSIGYDTGGYTGEWGNDGRLAMLHQKELVLNKEDTANMLNAVEILRGITNNIGADVLERMSGVRAGMLGSAFGGNTLDQNVHIEATFPGVKSSIEIQDALNNLVNMAAQRAQTR